jgi:hypothetical protein
MTSLTTIIYVRKLSTAMYTWKFGVACMGNHKPSSWQTSYYANAWDNGYFKLQHMPCLWKHVIDNFGVKYISNKNLKHLFSALCTETYKIVVDLAGNLYSGINLEWSYNKRWIDITMPVYAIKNLTRYNHLPPLKPQHCPYTPNPVIYGNDNQATTPSNTSPLLDAAGTKCIQQIVGSFLYYARAVYPTILMALSDRVYPTEETLAYVNRCLDYLWMHSNAKIRYIASDMIINVHLDASYLCAC